MCAIDGQARSLEAINLGPGSSSISVFNSGPNRSAWQAIVEGAVLAGVLDAADGVVAFYLAARMSPIQVLQYIASGVLGAASFQGGLPTAALGAALHFFIAFVAAAVYVATSRRVAALRVHPYLFGSTYGAAVYIFMNFVVLPLSAVPKSGISLGLLANGLIGHAIFVGLPIALAARRIGPAASR